MHDGFNFEPEDEMKGTSYTVQLDGKISQTRAFKDFAIGDFLVTTSKQHVGVKVGSHTIRWATDTSYHFGRYADNVKTSFVSENEQYLVPVSVEITVKL